MSAADIAQLNAPLFGLAFLALAILTACSAAQSGPDPLELATIAPWHVVPKSSPAQLLAAFDRFCVNGPPGLTAKDGSLRAAGYVQGHVASPRRAALYVVDDKRPAVLLTERTCGVRAISRTGQTNRVNQYISTEFPNARPVDPAHFGNTVEQVWQIDGGMIATMRNDQLGNRSAYTLSIFKPES